MDDLIRQDVEAEVAALLGLVRTTFDTTAYPNVAAGHEFDARSIELDRSLARVRRLFNDYLLQAWSHEIHHIVDDAQAKRRNRD